MPKIPRIMPTDNQLTTQSPNVLQRDPGPVGAGLKDIGSTVSTLGEMFKQANLVTEKTKAQNQLESSLNSIHAAAKADTDNSEQKRQQYQDQINKAVSDSSQIITLPGERANFNAEAQSKANITSQRINSVYLRNTVNEGKQNLDIYLNNKKNDFIEAQNPSEKNMAVMERDNKIDEMTKAGFLEPAEAIKLREFQKNDWAKGQVEYDIGTNPAMARDLLKDKQYPDISEEDRVKYLDKSNEAIRKNNKDALEESEMNRINHEADYLGQLSSGNLNWMTASDIANDVRAGRVSERFGLAMTDVIKAQGKFEPEAKENENYPEFINNIYKAKDQKELNNSLLSLLQAHKDISQEKLAVLINGAMQRAKSLPFSSSTGATIDPKQQAIDSGAMAVTNFGRRAGMNNTEIGDIYQNYNKDIAAGKSPQEAYGNATRTHAISQYPQAATMTNPPNMIIDSRSPIRVIFPRTSGKKNDGTTKSNNDLSK